MPHFLFPRNIEMCIKVLLLCFFLVKLSISMVRECHHVKPSNNYTDIQHFNAFAFTYYLHFSSFECLTYEFLPRTEYFTIINYEASTDFQKFVFHKYNYTWVIHEHWIFIYTCSIYYQAYGIGSARGMVNRSEIDKTVGFFSTKYNYSVFKHHLHYQSKPCKYIDYVRWTENGQRVFLYAYVLIAAVLAILLFWKIRRTISKKLFVL